MDADSPIRDMGVTDLNAGNALIKRCVNLYEVELLPEGEGHRVKRRDDQRVLVDGSAKGLLKLVQPLGFRYHEAEMYLTPRIGGVDNLSIDLVFDDDAIGEHLLKHRHVKAAERPHRITGGRRIGLELGRACVPVRTLPGPRFPIVEAADVNLVPVARRADEQRRA